MASSGGFCLVAWAAVEVVGMSEWKPIESAPMGEKIIVYGHKWNGEDDWGLATGSQRTDEWWETISKDTKKLRSKVVTEWDGFEGEPTHWMPKNTIAPPSPPKESA